jgi:hypothetical protein
METWHRWQDWGNVVLGAILFIAAFAYAAPAMAEYTFIVLGVLMFAIGLYLLATPSFIPGEWAEVVLGILAFVSPWIFGFASLSPINYIAWVIGVLAVILAGWVILTAPPETTTR